MLACGACGATVVAGAASKDPINSITIGRTAMSQTFPVPAPQCQRAPGGGYGKTTLQLCDWEPLHWNSTSF
jgi:hypothetical protein